MREHVLRLGKIEVLSARARYRAPNARALLIIVYRYSLLHYIYETSVKFEYNFFNSRALILFQFNAKSIHWIRAIAYHS